MVAAYDPARLTVHNVPLAKPTLRCYDNHAAELESLALLGLDCESIITALATRGLAADFGKALMSHHEYVLAEASKVCRATQPHPSHTHRRARRRCERNGARGGRCDARCQMPTSHHIARG